MNILSIDFGTTSVKLSILDENLAILATAKEPYAMHVLNGDWVEMDAAEILGAMVRGIGQLSAFAGTVGVIAYDAFSPSVVFMDADGEPLRPLITHLDRRSRRQTQDILDRMGAERFQAITGIQPFTGGASITTVLWVMENEPEIFRRTVKFGHLVTFIHRFLTGDWITDPTNASMTGLYQTTQWSTWSPEILETFGIPLEKLPDIAVSGTVAGTLTERAAGLCGLKPGIPVAVGSHDTTVAHVAAGNKQPGDILVVSGSNEMLSVLTDRPIVDARYYLRNAIKPGQWQVFAITASGIAIDWFRKECYRDMDESAFFATEVPRAITENVGRTDVRFLPYLAGDRQSLAPKKGGFSGITLASTRRDLLAAILTGIHEPVVETLRLCGERIALGRTIKLTGGMVTPEFVQLKQKLLPGFEFEIKPDGPIIANAMLALKGLENRSPVIRHQRQAKVYGISKSFS